MEASPSSPEDKRQESDTGCLRALRLSCTYTAADIRRRPRNMIIGIVAVMLLVFFSGVVLVGIWKAPYILLRLAELTVGEMDVVLYGGGTTPLINYTQMKEKMEDCGVVAGSAPRWMARANLMSEAAYLASATAGAGGASVKSTSANVLVIDSALEEEAGIGRGWTHRVIGYDEAHIFYSAANYIGVRPLRGERIRLSMNLSDLTSMLGSDNESLSSIFPTVVEKPTSVTDPMSFYLTAFFEMNQIEGDSIDLMDVIDASMAATMIDAIESTEGKYSSVLGNAVIMDSKQLLRLIMDQSCLFGPQVMQPKANFYFPTLADLFGISAAELSGVPIEEFAFLMVVMMRGRYDMYYADTNKRNRIMADKSNQLMESVGLDFDGNIEYPIAATIETFDTFRILMTASFITVVVGIVVLGCILMFALLQINAEERQFELAMIRAQGMPRTQIACILATQTLTFTIPGTALGIALVCAANAVLEALLAGFTKAPARLGDVPVVAAVISVVLGLVLPLLATWGPIRRALSGSLRDALDIYRQAYNEAHVKAIRLEEMGLSMWQVLLGIFLVVAGFMVYYLMPLSFIFNNMMMFFVLLDIVLVCMVAGLCMMLYVIEPYAESFVLFLLLWGSETRLSMLIKKNLSSHRDRNSRAYMMFLLSVALLTSSGIMFAILSTVSAQISELTTGAHITVMSSTFDTPLNDQEIDAFMRGDEAKPYVVNWAYTSFGLSEYPQVAGTTQVGTLIGNNRRLAVRAVTENFISATYPRYNMVADLNKKYTFTTAVGGKKDVVKSMYTNPPSGAAASEDSDGEVVTGFPAGVPRPDTTRKSSFVIPMILSAAAKDEIGLDVNSGSRLSYSYNVENGTKSTTFYMEPRALMKRLSGFIAISTLPIGFSSGSLLMPVNYFKKLLDPIELDYGSDANVTLDDEAVTEVRMATLYVMLKDGVTKSQRESFVNALQAHTNTMSHTTVDTIATVKQMEQVQNLIMYFFYFTAAICIVLCAFMMWLTFISNVQLNSWSFGVLRSLGFRTAQLVRSAIYESLSIVVSAFVLGVAVGIVVGVTMAAQLSSFMVIPFQFIFPYILVLIILGLALLAAVFGSVIPYIYLSKKPIATVLKGM